MTASLWLLFATFRANAAESSVVFRFPSMRRRAFSDFCTTISILLIRSLRLSGSSSTSRSPGIMIDCPSGKLSQSISSSELSMRMESSSLVMSSAMEASVSPTWMVYRAGPVTTVPSSTIDSIVVLPSNWHLSSTTSVEASLPVSFTVTRKSDFLAVQYFSRRTFFSSWDIKYLTPQTPPPSKPATNSKPISFPRAKPPLAALG